MQLRQEVVDRRRLSIYSGPRLLDQKLEARAGLRIKGIEKLVEVDRAERAVGPKCATALDFGATPDRGDLDVLLRQQRRVPNPCCRVLVQRRVMRRDPHGDER